jgi:hypothetical protein
VVEYLLDAQSAVERIDDSACGRSQFTLIAV